MVTYSVIQQEIEKLEWQNDKGLNSATQRTIALLQALNLLIFHIERIADKLESRPRKS